MQDIGQSNEDKTGENDEHTKPSEPFKLLFEENHAEQAWMTTMREEVEREREKEYKLKLLHVK